ncbi:MAG: hypothetical protein QM621_14660 [Aeromicrobium sp.]|uniref:hypothetical protein n=1 Tax=Aeromicrobium sp. TaxID=1871063 RepID=UPI0039E404D9
MTWVTIGAVATLATAVSAVVTVVTSIWWRWRDRPAAEWMAVSSSACWLEERPGIGADSFPTLWCAISNVGDGSAYRVAVSAPTARWLVTNLPEELRPAKVSDPKVIGAMRPGDTFIVDMGCDAELWDSCEIVVEWSAPPTRRRRKWFGVVSTRQRQRLRLPAIEARPEIEPYRP